tara:strand:+ start:1744 stop:2301 length:558 start_codon:yes stop_codon:yes gene_type:complete
MSFNFVAGKPAHPINLTPIMSGNFTGDIDGDGTDLENVSHIGQTNASNHNIVFFDGTTTGLAGNEMNIRGDTRFQFDRGSNIFTANSGMVHGRSEISSHYSILSSDYYVGCNQTASITVTLPFASTLSSGQTFTIKDETGNANSYNITITTKGSDAIDGQQNITIQSAYGAVNLYSNGNNKFFIF